MDRVPVNAYDDVPYPSHAFAATSPDRLAVVGAILGLKTADPRRARVLELGSSSGGNLLGHAAANPESRVLGLDLSARQIALGREDIAALGLANARLEVADLAAWEPEPGAWDYVICHGVYSWVPDAVQQAILGICRRALAPGGVAVVSWNAHPGWQVQGMVRDAMRYLVDPDAPLAHRAARAQDVLRVLANARDEDSPAARTLATLAAQLEALPDSYVAHEYLEACNAPRYLAQFTREVSSAGLRYLGDSNLGRGLPQLLEPPLRDRLAALAPNQIALEQYLDFVDCRPFHTSLLTRREEMVRRDLSSFDAGSFWLSSAGPPGDDPGVDPTWRALLERLYAARPRPIPFDDLVGDGDRAALSAAVLTAFLTGGVDLHRHPHATVARAGDRPRGWTVARHDAARRHMVSTLWHTTVLLSPLDLLLLHRCDGTRTVDALAAELAPVFAAHPDLAEDGTPERAAARIRDRLDFLSDLGVMEG